MSTIKSTLNLQTGTLFPQSFHFSKTMSTTITENEGFGRLNLTGGNPQSLSNLVIGPKGGYLYAQALPTNPANVGIKIYSVNDNSNFATLMPGELAIIPLSAAVGGLYAQATTEDNASIDFFVGNKGGEWGDSVLFNYVDNNLQNNQLLFFDSEYGEYKTIDTGLDKNQYNFNGWNFVQNSGYSLRYYNGSYTFVFITKDGRMLDKIEISGSYNWEEVNGKGVLISNQTNSSTYDFIYFDGVKTYTHTIQNINGFVYEDNWDWTAIDGSVVISTSNTDNTNSLYVINGENITNIYTYNNSDNLNVNAYVYEFANIIYLSIYDNNVDYYRGFNIYNTGGVLLHEVAFPENTINNIDYYYYGAGYLQLVTQGNNNTYYLYNYNQTTNKLLGKDNDLTVDGNVYNAYTVYAQSKWSNNIYGFDPRNNYNQDGVYISFNNANYNSNQFLTLSSISSYKGMWICGNMTTFREVNPSVNGVFNPSPWNDDTIRPTSTGVFLAWNANGDASTLLQLVYLPASDNGYPTSSYLTDSFGNNISTNYNDWYFRPFGLYQLTAMYDMNQGNTIYKAANGLTGILDTLTVSGSSYDIYNKFNTFYLNNSYTQKNYYFNIVNNKFVEIPVFHTDVLQNWEAAFRTGITEDRLILVKYLNNGTDGLNRVAVLSNGRISDEFTMPTPGGDNDYGFNFGYENFYYFYTNDNNDYVVNMYDLLGNLVTTVTVARTTYQNVWNSISNYDGNQAVRGKRASYIFSDNSNDYNFVMMTPNGAIEKVLTNISNLNVIVNDYVYWNY